jgi:tRNA 2-thiouridine synthesizing protein A
MNDHEATGDVLLPAPAGVLEFLGSRESAGAACAVLTPAIRSRLREMAPGQVLLVRTDDPTAPLDVAAWCGLTGHALRATREQDGVFNFFIQKQDKT